jgi:hypothetical protein
MQTLWVRPCALARLSCSLIAAIKAPITNNKGNLVGLKVVNTELSAHGRAKIAYFD